MAQGTYLAVELSGAGGIRLRGDGPMRVPRTCSPPPITSSWLRLAAGADLVFLADSFVPPSAEPGAGPLDWTPWRSPRESRPWWPGSGWCPP